jgi:hypothetical protein
MDEMLNNFWFLLFAMITITSVVGTVASAWKKMRRDEQETALKQEMLRREMSVEEMERVLRLGAKPARENEVGAGHDSKIIEELAMKLGQCEASAATIEEVVTAVRAADPALQNSVIRAIRGIECGAGEINEAQILGVVRALTRPVPAEKRTVPPASAAIQLQPEPELHPIEPV